MGLLGLALLQSKSGSTRAKVTRRLSTALDSAFGPSSKLVNVAIMLFQLADPLYE
jgi:hypothetical protein